MEQLVSFLIVSLYVLMGYFVRRIIFSNERRVGFKVLISFLFLSVLPMAYYILLIVGALATSVGLQFDLGHANLLAVIVVGIVTLAGISHLLIVWALFFLKKRNGGNL